MACKRIFFLFQYILFTMIVKVLLKLHVSNYHQKTQIVLVTFWELGKTIQGLIYPNKYWNIFQLIYKQSCQPLTRLFDSDWLYINWNMFQHFKTIAVILRFIYFPGCYQELWQNKILQIIISHNNFFLMSKILSGWLKTNQCSFHQNIVYIHLQDWCSKLVSAIFYQVFVFHQMIALQKLWKMFLISSKKLFSFLDI